MTNETRKTLVLLKAQLAACEEAARRFAALKDTLQQSASGGAMTCIYNLVNHLVPEALFDAG